jgi:hypothetical protein
MKYWKLLSIFICLSLGTFTACSLSIGGLGGVAEEDDDDDDDNDYFPSDIVDSISGTYDLEMRFIDDQCGMGDDDDDGGGEDDGDMVVIEFSGDSIRFWTESDEYLTPRLEVDNLIFEDERFESPEMTHDMFDCAMYQELSGVMEFDGDSMEGTFDVWMVWDGPECEEMFNEANNSGEPFDGPPPDGCYVTIEITGTKISDDTDPGAIDDSDDDGGNDGDDDCECWADECCNESCGDDPDCSGSVEPSSPCEDICQSFSDCGMVDNWDTCINECETSFDDSSEFWEIYGCITDSSCADIGSCFLLTNDDLYGTWRISYSAVSHDSCNGYFYPDEGDFRVIGDFGTGTEYHINSTHQTSWSLSDNTLSIYNNSPVIISNVETGYDCELTLDIYGDFAGDWDYLSGTMTYVLNWAGSECTNYFNNLDIYKPYYAPQSGCNASYWEDIEKVYPNDYQFGLLEDDFDIH